MDVATAASDPGLQTVDRFVEAVTLPRSARTPGELLDAASAAVVMLAR